jgi:hypothetical protein
MSASCVDAEFVVAAAQVLHERETTDDRALRSGRSSSRASVGIVL